MIGIEVITSMDFYSAHLTANKRMEGVDIPVIHQHIFSIVSIPTLAAIVHRRSVEPGKLYEEKGVSLQVFRAHGPDDETASTNDMPIQVDGSGLSPWSQP